MAIKDFDQIISAIKEEKGEEGPEFKLGGVEFHCRPFISTGEYAEFSEETSESDPLYFYKFLEKFIVEEQNEEFHAVIRNKDLDTPSEIIAQIVTWLGEEYSKRPLKRSKSSTKA